MARHHRIHQALYQLTQQAATTTECLLRPPPSLLGSPCCELQQRRYPPISRSQVVRFRSREQIGQDFSHRAESCREATQAQKIYFYCKTSYVCYLGLFGAALEALHPDLPHPTPSLNTWAQKNAQVRCIHASLVNPIQRGAVGGGWVCLHPPTTS